MEDNMEEVFCRGDLVFAKVGGYPPWPAQVEGLGPKSSMASKYLVLFFGTFERAICKDSDLFHYEKYKNKYGKCRWRGFQEAVRQIEEEAALLKNSSAVVQKNNRTAVSADVDKISKHTNSSPNLVSSVASNAPSWKTSKRSLSGSTNSPCTSPAMVTEIDINCPSANISENNSSISVKTSAVGVSGKTSISDPMQALPEIIIVEDEDKQERSSPVQTNLSLEADGKVISILDKICDRLDTFEKKVESHENTEVLKKGFESLEAVFCKFMSQKEHQQPTQSVLSVSSVNNSDKGGTTSGEDSFTFVTADTSVSCLDVSEESSAVVQKKKRTAASADLDKISELSNSSPRTKAYVASSAPSCKTRQSALSGSANSSSTSPAVATEQGIHSSSTNISENNSVKSIKSAAVSVSGKTNITHTSPETNIAEDEEIQERSCLVKSTLSMKADDKVISILDKICDRQDILEKKVESNSKLCERIHENTEVLKKGFESLEAAFHKFMSQKEQQQPTESVLSVSTVKSSDRSGTSTGDGSLTYVSTDNSASCLRASGEVDLGNGIMCSPLYAKKLKSTENINTWCRALLLGHYGEEKAKRMRYQIHGKNKHHLFPFSMAFKDVALEQYSLFLERTKNSYSQKEVQTILGKLSQVARDMSGRRNTGQFSGHGRSMAKKVAAAAAKKHLNTKNNCMLSETDGKIILQCDEIVRNFLLNESTGDLVVLHDEPQ